MEKIEKIKALSESLSKLYKELDTNIAYADDATKKALIIEGTNYVIKELGNHYLVTVTESAKEAIYKAFTGANSYSPGIDAYWAKVLNKDVYYGQNDRGVYITFQTDRGWSGGSLRKESGESKYYIPGLKVQDGDVYIDWDNGGYETVETIITA